MVEPMETRVMLTAAVASLPATAFTATPDLVRLSGKPLGSTSPNGMGYSVAQMRGGYGLGGSFKFCHASDRRSLVPTSAA